MSALATYLILGAVIYAVTWFSVDGAPVQKFIMSNLVICIYNLVVVILAMTGVAGLLFGA